MDGIFELITEVSVWLVSRLSRDKFPELVTIILVPIGLVAMLGLLVAIGPTITLTCTRQVASDVYCSYDSQIFLMGGTADGIQHVYRAVNQRGLCDGSNCSYRIELETADGRKILSDQFTSGSKADFVDRLNSFIADHSQTTIELTQAPDVSGLLPYCLIVVALILILGGYRLRQKIVQRQRRSQLGANGG